MQNSSKIRAFFLNVVLLILSSAILISILEIWLQITSTRKADNFATTKEWHKKFVTRNSHGLRDKEYSYNKPDEIYRILVLGDSQTFGHGIKRLEDTWHKKLEVLLNKGFSNQKFEVIALAGEGWNTDTQLYELFRRGFKYDPDLVLLAFYHNDVPRGQFFDCPLSDIDVLPNYKIFNRIKKHSEIYSFLKLRINRLFENSNQKTKFSDCVNLTFQSRGWEMEKVYLNTLLTASKVKSFHFMIAHIPLLYKLGDNYPLKISHKIIEEYCKTMGIYYIDLFKTSFKNLKAKDLVISKTDRHLNIEGAKVVAQGLYEKLKPLKKYQNLPFFSKAFNLFELLDTSELPETVDQKWGGFKKNINLIHANSSNKKLTVEKNGGKFFFKIKENLNAKTITSKIYLDKIGNFLSREKSIIFPNHPNKNLIESVLHKDDFFDLKVFKNQPKQISLHRKFVLQSSQFNINSIQLEENTLFADPKVIEEKVFSNTFHPSSQLTKTDKELFFQKKINNPKLKVKYFRKTLTEQEQYLESKELADLIDETILLKAFTTWPRYGAKKYADQFANLIAEKKSSKTSLKAIARYYSLIKTYDKLDNLFKDNPKVFNNR